MKESLKATLLANREESIFLDSSLYTNADLLPLEQESIFRRAWLYVGDAANLPEPGTVRVTEAAGSSILLVRTADGSLKAFHNVCPHRASILCTRSEVGLKQLVCPYHAWAFDLEGQLIGTPARERFPDRFRLENFSLKSLRCEQWQGFTFVCFDDKAPPLLEFLGEIPNSLGKHRTEKTESLVKMSYQVACNWKNFHDNTLCDYHLPMVHPETLHPVQGPVRFYEHHFWEYVNLLYTPTTPQWREQFPALEHLSDRARFGFFTYGIFPNLHLVAFPHGVLGWIRIDPLSVDTCRVNLDIYGIPGISPEAADLEQSFNATTQEDIAITEGVQKGYASGIYSPGIANGLEERILHQQRLIRRFLLAGLQ